MENIASEAKPPNNAKVILWTSTDDPIMVDVNVKSSDMIKPETMPIMMEILNEKISTGTKVKSSILSLIVFNTKNITPNKDAKSILCKTT